MKNSVGICDGQVSASAGSPTSSDAELSRYSPDIALSWLETEPDRRHKVIDGSLCFADISGFTFLTERLAARGRNGAEELVEVLSTVFATMVRDANDRGGQLLKFGGDALLFLFDRAGHARDACSAAIEMQRSLRRAVEIPTAVGRLRLQMSVGVASGDIHAFLVGSSHREFVVAGAVVSATLAAEHAATAGQIVISPATATQLPPSAVRRTDEGRFLLRRRAPLDPPSAALPRSGFDSATARGLLSESLLRVLSSRPDPAHRVATMAFIRFSGLDHMIAADPVAACHALDRTVATVQNALHAEGVSLLHVDVEVDGGKFVCASGVTLASEDDEGRMLRAVLAIAGVTVPLTLQMGVNRGHVFVASIGGEARATFSAMGDSMNTAARITAAAPPGVIYAHPAVLEHARSIYVTKPAGSFMFKGKSEAIPLYEVAQETGVRIDVDEPQLRFHGRDAELAHLRDVLQAAADGRGCAVAIVASPGLGKSRLAYEALRQQHLVPAVRIRAEPNGVASAYRPFRALLHSMLGVTSGDVDAMAAQFLAGLHRLDPTLLSLAPLLADVAQTNVAPTPASDVIAEENRPDRTADLLIRVIERAFPGPLVILVDDAQWVDAASSHLLSRLEVATATLPWLLAVARRDTEGGFVPDTRDAIKLAPLDNAAVRQIVISSTASAPLQAHEIDVIVTRSEGNPAYVEQLIHITRSGGSVDQTSGSIQSVVAARIDMLAAPTRRAIAVASVLGRSFRRQLLIDVLRNEDLEFDSALESDLAAFLEPDGELRFRFHSGIVREVVYERMAFRTRTRLHGAAGNTLEKIVAGTDVDVEALAFHFAAAGDNERTWQYGLRAADRAQIAYANVEAAIHLERALEAGRRLDTVDDGERTRRWLQLGDTRDRAGMLDRANDAYRKAARLIGREALGRADLLLRRARTNERSGSFSLALGEASRARSLLASVSGVEAATRRADALAFSALVRQRQERAAEALRLAERAVAEAADVGAQSAQARASNVVSWAATMLDRPDATEWAQRALALYEIVGDLVGQADMTNNLGIQAYYKGNWDETIAYYRRSRESCAKVGNIIDAALTDANIAEVLVNQRRFDDAEPLLRDASRVMRTTGYRAGAAFADMHLARLLARRGDTESAEPILVATIAELASLGRMASAYEATLVKAECLAIAGRADDALGELAIASELTTDDVSILDATRARVAGQALASAGRVEEAAAMLEEGIGAARARGLDYELGLMLHEVSSLPVAVRTGSDEEPAEESARLLARLGVIVTG